MPLDSIRDRFPTEPEVDLGGKSARQYMDAYDTRNISYGSPYDQKDLGMVGQGLSDAYMSSIMELPMMAMEYLMPDDPYEAGVLQSGPQDRMREGEFKWQEHMEGQSQDPSYATGQDFGQALGVIADPFIDLPLMGVPALGKMMKLSPDTTAKMGTGIMGRLMDETGALVGQRGMEKLGVDPASDLVGQYSGLWDKGVRAEVDDSTFEVLDFRPTGGGLVYRHKPQIAAYGQTKLTGKDLPEDVGGFYKKPEMWQGKSGVVHESEPEKIFINEQMRDEWDDIVSHELTHGTQYKEGLAGGGNPADFFNVALDEEKNRLARITRYNDELKRNVANRDIIKDDILKGYESKSNGEVEISRLESEYQRLMDEKLQVVSSGSFDPVAAKSEAFKKYERLAGEWEARNIGTRTTLSADDKRLGEVVEKLGVKFRAGQPFSTADNFALEDLIVRMK